MMAFYWGISITSWFSALLPFFLWRRSWKPNRIIRLVMLLALCSFLFDLGSYIISFGFKSNNYPVGNLFLLVQALILLAIYTDVLKIKTTIMFMAGIFYTVLFAINYFFIQGPYVVNSYVVVVGSVGFIMLSLLYFRELLRNLPETFVHRVPMVWVNVAVLIYFSGNLFLFMLYNYFVSGIWILHNILNITKNVLLFVDF